MALIPTLQLPALSTLVLALSPYVVWDLAAYGRLARNLTPLLPAYRIVVAPLTRKKWDSTKDVWRSPEPVSTSTELGSYRLGDPVSDYWVRKAGLPGWVGIKHKRATVYAISKLSKGWLNTSEKPSDLARPYPSPSVRRENRGQRARLPGILCALAEDQGEDSGEVTEYQDDYSGILDKDSEARFLEEHFRGKFPWNSTWKGESLEDTEPVGDTCSRSEES